MIRLGVLGANGRMGRAVLKEAHQMGFTISSAIEYDENPNVGYSLKELGICNSEEVISGTSKIQKYYDETDAFISFTNPAAEIANIKLLENSRVPLVIGTTGFTTEQLEYLINEITETRACVMASNFSIGINILYQILESLANIPDNYDVSVTEIHHTAKKDSPSGTAKQLAKIIQRNKGYSNIITGRINGELRTKNELEVLSLRVGEVPGIHSVVIAGNQEYIRLEHTAFSRDVFAQGALKAAEWVCKQSKLGIYSMRDVLSEALS